MNDTEETARRLFAVATEDVPPGIDLLRAVQAQSRARVVRARALAAAGAAGSVALVAGITLSAAPAPSAFAQVTHAAARTAAASYTVRSDQKIVDIGGLRSKPWATAYGEFDPVHEVGEFTDNLGAQIRWVGGSTYVFLTDDLRAAYQRIGPPVPAGVSWEQLAGLPLPSRGSPTALGMLSVFPGFLGSVDPQDLLALLQSATDVRETGPGVRAWLDRYGVFVHRRHHAERACAHARGPARHGRCRPAGTGPAARRAGVVRDDREPGRDHVRGLRAAGLGEPAAR